MSEPYVTIGGKQVYPHPPASAEVHATQRTGGTTWEEGWQRETTRASVPAGGILLVLALVFVGWRIIRRLRRSA